MSVNSKTREPNPSQRKEIEKSVANFADSDFVLREWRVTNGANFLDGVEPPKEHLYVEFLYLDPNLGDEDGQHQPGLEVHVYGPAGEVIDCHDFG